MNRVQRTALLAFFLLLLMAVCGWWLGGKQARPADAEPKAVLLDPGALETVRLLPPERRRQYVDAERFLAPPVADPESSQAGRKPGAAVPSAVVAAPNPITNAERGAYRVVRVHQNETLGQIAARELGDAKRWRDLLRWNGITDERKLSVGQELKIYTQTTAVEAAASERATSVGVVPPGTYHIVEAGEILGRISQEYYGTTKEVDRILAANHIQDPRKIKVGQKLLIPPTE